MSKKLLDWLVQELDRRGWSQREFARRADVSQTLVNRTMSGGDMKVSPRFCLNIAETLEVSPVLILRLAGWLPDEPPPIELTSPLSQEILRLVEEMPPEKRKQILEYVRFIHQQDEERE